MAEYKVEALSQEEFAGIQTGDTLLFGAYPKILGGEPLPITWEVLEKADGRLLLLSTHGIDAVPYDSRSLDIFFQGKITWESCDLRAYLNNDLFFGAFHEKERALIAPTPLSSSDEEKADRLFCLSCSQAVTYQKTKATPFTELAKSKGATPYFWNGGTEWWLRSTSDGDGSHAYYVGAEWGVKGDAATWLTYAVRPALWLDPMGNHPAGQTASTANKSTDLTHTKEGKVDFCVSDPKENANLSPLSFDPKTLRVGDRILFGTYEQGSGKEPIEWRVLEMASDKALCITAKGIDSQPFHSACTEVTWENASLRKWLNSTFFTAAFTEGERVRILPTILDNGKNPQTTDRVFVLSEAEVEKYYGGGIGDTRGHAAPTAYAIAQGAHKHQSGTCSWWLRTSSFRFADHAMIFYFTSLLYGGDKVTDPTHTVRPAIWLSLK